MKKAIIPASLLVVLAIVIYLYRGFLAPFVPAAVSDETLLDTLEVPAGFHIELYAPDLPGARSMTLSPNGTLFVGTRTKGRVYAVRDENGDQRADRVYTLDTGLNMPNGVALRDGSLYVAEVNRILRYDDVESRLDNPPEPVVVRDDYPTDTHHGWKFIAFGPDGKLYIPVGIPCNVCRPDNEIYGTITRMNPDGSEREIYARGVRNSVGFDWHPKTGELWFTDNGRDWLGDNRPPDELNRVSEKEEHFGFPFCHGEDIPDPEFGFDCSMFTPPARELGPHVASLGMRFGHNSNFPERYRNGIFIAEHGSWNRKDPIGYRITFVPLNDKGEVQGYEVFAEGWLAEEGSVLGRPVDIQFIKDGSMLVSDDKGGRIYRISYRP